MFYYNLTIGKMLHSNCLLQAFFLPEIQVTYHLKYHLTGAGNLMQRWTVDFYVIHPT